VRTLTHRRELGGSDDVRYLESHARCIRRLPANRRNRSCALGTAASAPPRGGWIVAHRKVGALQRPLLKIDAKTS